MITRRARWSGASLALVLLLAALPHDAPAADDGGSHHPERTPDALHQTTASPPASAQSSPPPPAALSIDPTLLALLGGAPAAGAALASIRSLPPEKARPYAAALIELLRAQNLDVVEGIDEDALVSALEHATGQSLGADWGALMRWSAGEPDDAPLPKGFTGWKGKLLSRLDPHFGELLALGIPSRVRTDEIVWGGVAYEGIPALDHPETIPAAAATWLGDQEPVFGVALRGEAHAYPLRILDWHEMANDVVGGVPIALAYCTLCGTGIAYDARAPDGRTYTFGSSGLLMRSNKLMVDRQTHSLWNQFTGRPVVGPLADPRAGDWRLRIVPSVVTTWGRWKREHPGTRVVSLHTGYNRSYVPGAAYGDYFASPDTMFPVRIRRDELPPKARVFGLQRGGHTRAYPLDTLLRAGVTNDRLGKSAVVIVTEGPEIEVDGQSIRTGAPRHYSAGGTVRAYESRPGLRFRRPSAGPSGPSEDALVIEDEDGRLWHTTEDKLIGPDGKEELPRITGILSYWFAWQAYHPHTELYR